MDYWRQKKWKVRRIYCLGALVCDVANCKWAGAPLTGKGKIADYLELCVEFSLFSCLTSSADCISLTEIQHVREVLANALGMCTIKLAPLHSATLMWIRRPAGESCNMLVITIIPGLNPRSQICSLKACLWTRLWRTQTQVPSSSRWSFFSLFWLLSVEFNWCDVFFWTFNFQSYASPMPQRNPLKVWLRFMDPY